MADRLVTPEELASAIQQTDLDRATCELVIEGATAVVQALVNQRLILGSSTIQLDAPYGAFLDLPGGPVVSVESVQIKGEDVTDWELYGDRLFRSIGWIPVSCYPHYPPVTVEYTHGYAPGSQDLELARTVVLALAAEAYSNPEGVSRESIDDYSVAYDRAGRTLDSMPFLRSALLRKYGGAASVINIGSAV